MLLLMATGIFWFVSWRHWPRRIFATAAEGTALQRQLRTQAAPLLSYQQSVRRRSCLISDHVAR
jgi:hypothetical protein